MNPVRPQEMEAVRAANVLNGTDPDCTNWIRTYKDYKPGEVHAPAPVQVNCAGGGSRRAPPAAGFAVGLGLAADSRGRSAARTRLLWTGDWRTSGRLTEARCPSSET